MLVVMIKIKLCDLFFLTQGKACMNVNLLRSSQKYVVMAQTCTLYRNVLDGYSSTNHEAEC